VFDLVGAAGGGEQGPTSTKEKRVATRAAAKDESASRLGKDFNDIRSIQWYNWKGAVARSYIR
jgi:hypothetical protein